MSTTPLIVLKFGGSVLPAACGLRKAVHEIYRWRRAGWRVVAVVSTFAGRTDELCRDCDALGSAADSPARAALLGTGEIETSARLALELERAGVPAHAIAPGAAGIVAVGDATDAEPVSLAGWRLPDLVLEHPVVVVPGYVATDETSRPVVLGRGGSDLTALFLAAELDADRCRLIKDVDGLYVSDPAGDGPAPDRYACAHYDDALATDGSILQHKAVRFAAERGMEFELGAFNSEAVTRIGDLATVLEPAPIRSAPLRIGLLGHGTVGGGVAALLRDYPDEFVLRGVSVRDAARHPELRGERVWTEPSALADGDLDVVVETIGGTGEAGRAVKTAFRRGAHVVTANKSLLARCGPDLEALAAARGATLLAGASVGGGVPVLETLTASRGDGVRAVEGILCGTANFVLEKLDEGCSLDEAVAEAQRRGLAEAAPSRDLDGRDAADKLAVIADRLGGPAPIAEAIARQAIGEAPHRAGTRQIASLRRTTAGWAAEVRLDAPAGDSFLRRARGCQNAVLIEYESGRRETLLGDGAGRWPTATAVLGDLLEIARNRQQRKVLAFPGAFDGDGPAFESESSAGTG